MGSIFVSTSGNDSTGIGTSGNPYATPGKAASVKAAGDKVFVQQGTYVCTTATANVAGGVVNDTLGGTGPSAEGRWEGYAVTPGDRAGRFTMQLAASLTTSAITIFALAGNNATVDGINVDGNTGNTQVTGLKLANTYMHVIRAKATRCTKYGFDLNYTAGSGSWWARFLEAVSCSGTAAIALSNGDLSFFDAHGNTCTGLLINFSSTVADGNSYNNTGGSSSGFVTDSVGWRGRRLNAYANGSHGFDISGNFGYAGLLADSISYGNGGAGYNSSAVEDGAYLLNCAGGHNTSGNYNSTNLPRVENFVALTATDAAGPWVDPANGNFALNNTANGGGTGGGAALRAAGSGGVYPAGTTTGYGDVGSAQHQDSGGGSASIIRVGFDGGYGA